MQKCSAEYIPSFCTHTVTEKERNDAEEAEGTECYRDTFIKTPKENFFLRNEAPPPTLTCSGGKLLPIMLKQNWTYIFSTMNAEMRIDSCNERLDSR
jgi:hypothetical protein